MNVGLLIMYILILYLGHAYEYVASVMVNIKYRLFVLHVGAATDEKVEHSVVVLVVLDYLNY